MIYFLIISFLAYSVGMVIWGVHIGHTDAKFLLVDDLEERDYYKALWEGYQKEVSLRKQRENVDV